MNNLEAKTFDLNIENSEHKSEFTRIIIQQLQQCGDYTRIHRKNSLIKIETHGSQWNNYGSERT